MRICDVIHNMIKEQRFSDDDYYHHEGNFLDRFYESPSYEVLKDEPSVDPRVSRYHFVRLAAVAHRLSNLYHYQPPQWVFIRPQFMDLVPPHFQCNAKDDLMIILILESPPEFAIRNIFVLSNVLSRC